MKGFVQVPRAVLESEWWADATPLARNLWLVLFAGANWKPGVTARGLALQPGQIVTSWSALADALAWRDREKHRTENPSLMEVRRTAAFLRKAGELTWAPTGAPNYTGLVVTLARWALHVNSCSEATDASTDGATGGLSEPRHHMKKNYGSVQGGALTDPRGTLEQREEWLKAEQEGWEAH